MADDFVNFDNALNELGLSAEQLKRLVSEGQIRAVRGENDSMRFRRDELERLKQQVGGGSDESSDTLTDDLLFDEADDLDVEDEGMATAQISSEDTLVGEDDGLTMAPVKPAVRPAKGPAGGRGGRGGGRGGRPAPAAAAASTAAPTSVRRTTGRSTRMRQMDEERASGVGIGLTVVMGLTLVVALYASLVWLDIPSGEGASSVTEGIAKQMVETFADTARPKP